MPAHEAHTIEDVVERLWPFVLGLGGLGKLLQAVTKKIAEAKPEPPDDEPDPPSLDYVRILEADRAEDRAKIARLEGQVADLYNALDSGTRRGALDPPEKP